ncbi:MAG TPA: serine/threonine-protein kinase [Planctomycetota bacterium]|nr:serine/threonine-protein kinase [Planctomycetota bacterium]
MPPPDASPAPFDGEYEDLLFRALERFDAAGAAGLEQFLAEHREQAPRLRAHLEHLHRMGLTGGPSAPEAPPPDRLGDFRILAPLGQGGMGIVYRAVQESLGREVALKLVRPEQLYFPGARERFRREVEIVARLQHPGIVPVYAVGNEEGVPYMAMELVRGATLADVITHLAGREPSSLEGRDLDRAIAACTGDTEPGELAEPFRGDWTTVVLRIVREVAEALEHAHRRGVLHRDVKPSNVMLTRAGRVLLLDFGLAGDATAERLTRTGSALGSLAYMPPELLTGEPATRDARGDVYSLGASCWELLALRLPYQSSDPVQLQRLAAAAARPRLSTLLPGVAWDVEMVLATALEPDPARRYASASLFSRDLDNVLAHRPIAAREPGPWLRLRRWSQRHPARATAAVAVLVALFAGPSLWAWQENRMRLLTEVQRDELARINKALDRANAAAVAQAQSARANLAQLQKAVDTMLAKVGAESLRDIPHMEKVRAELLQEALRFYEGVLAQQPDDPAVQLEIARVRVRAAEVQGMLADYEGATGNLERAIADLGPFAANDDVVALELMGAKGRLPTLQRLRGNLPAAAAAAAAALQGWQELVARSDDAAVQKGLGDASIEAGYIAADQGDVARALAGLEEGLAGLDAWRSEHGESDQLVHLQARMLDRTAIWTYALAMQQHDRAAAMRQLERVAEMHGRAAKLWPQLLAKAPDDAAVRGDAADNAVDRAIALVALQRLPEAMEPMGTGVRLLAELVADFPGARRRLAQLASARLDFAGMLGSTGDLDGTQQQVKAARDAYEQLCREAPDNDEYQLGLCHALQTQATMTFEMQQRPQDALPLADAASAAIDRALAVRPASNLYRLVRRKVCETQAEVLLALGDHARASTAARGLVDPRWAPAQPALCAALLARAAPLAAADPALGDAERASAAAAYHDEAKSMLTAAVAKGLDLEDLHRDPAYAGQWGKPAFEELCKQVAADSH